MKQEQLLERSFKVGDVTHNLKVISGGAEPESSAWWAAQYTKLASKNLTAERFIDLWASFIRNDSEIKNWTITDYINSLNSAQINKQFEVEYNGEKKTTNLLTLAIETNQTAALSALIKNLSASSATAMPSLFALAMCNKWDQVLSTLEQPSNAIKNDLNTLENGQTLLHLALSTSRTNIAEKLIGLNAKCDIANKYNRLPLHLAIASGQQEVAGKLFEKYPEALEHKDESNKTPLYYAAGKLRASPLFEKMQNYVEQVSQSTTTQQARSI
ncbi:hypothetical protein NF27_DP02130 [Candidatus Jidaibacter acanthamoeba]|uniref:Uncharacterized protein n=1 Tax=Candidatus Jidaibacter acanthamoebae TaxID=86105 RepID=A0A0C1QJG8_9RICK|nr:ankyrin repeat domain-containing protein [Candidatus Jidaibacter acanthamoeba]KIE05669.1 hypothetical protein NF27_DP02130 [Candidatus Jidaibacter acanthamoeba]